MFVGQLEDPPTSFEGVERTACRKLFPGPAFWITPGVLQNLKILGFPAELPILSNLALAAKSRVCRGENQQHGGLLVYQRTRRLRQALASCDDLARLSWVHTWAHGNFLFRLEAADLQVQSCLDIRQQTGALPVEYWQWLIENAGVGVGAGAVPRERRRRQLSWQAVATKLAQQPTMTSIQVDFRCRLNKFPMRTLPGYRVARAIHFFKRLNGLVAPRVVAAYIRSICDGWATHARFQVVATCRFGCGVSRDSLTHIVRRPRALEWSERYARLRRPPLGWETDFSSA